MRQAREEKGLNLSDVAEQTRISSLYLEAIENDDYKILPGGIFNKGFIKSYAKFVGINEQEALMDYQANLARSEGIAENEQRVYKPEVMTDHSGSMLPTIIVAALVLAIMTAGILYLVSYLRAPSSTTASNISKPAANTSNETPNGNSTEPATGGAPDMASLKVEVKATSDVSLTATVDGNRPATSLVHAGSSQTFEPKQSLKLSYSRSLANAVQIVMNGKSIAPPANPLDPKRSVIEFEIDKDNLTQIWSTGSITASPATESSANMAVAAATPKPSPKATSSATTTTANIAVPRPTMQTRPTPKPTIITVGTPKTPH